MPNQDGTGQRSARPRAGRRGGRGRGNRPLGSSVCTCPKCENEVAHKRGVPCSERKCPKCETLMKGVNCL